MRTNYKCSRNINRIKSPKAPWIYKHPIFFGKVKQLIFFQKKNKKYIWECKRIEKKDNTKKKISNAYTINISLRNYEVMNLGVETKTKQISTKWKKKKK